VCSNVAAEGRCIDCTLQGTAMSKLSRMQMHLAVCQERDSPSTFTQKRAHAYRYAAQLYRRSCTLHVYSQLACDDVPCLLLATLILGLKELERSHAHVVPR